MKQSTKNSLLIIGFLLAILFAYQFSFSKTLETKSELDSLKLQIDQNKLVPQNILGLKSKETYLDSIISNSRNESTSLQNNLLNVLNKNSQEYSFKIINFKEPHLGVASDSTHITSFQFTIEGKYKDLEKMLYKLENEHSLGSTSHISFEKKKDYRLNKTFLQCSVIMQNVEWKLYTKTEYATLIFPDLDPLKLMHIWVYLVTNYWTYLERGNFLKNNLVKTGIYTLLQLALWTRWSKPSIETISKLEKALVNYLGYFYVANEINFPWGQ